MFFSAFADPNSEPTEDTQTEDTQEKDSEDSQDNNEEGTESPPSEATESSSPAPDTPEEKKEESSPTPETETETDTKSETDTQSETDTKPETVSEPQPEVKKSSETDGNAQKTKKPAAPTIDISDAEMLKNISRKQLRWLRPLPERFEQNPYLHVDFSAYCLEWGEFQLGLSTVKAGLLPKTQVGTSIPLWAVGLQNVDAKINLLRYGAFDLALDGNWLSLPTDDFRMSFLGGGLNTSIRIMEPWTIHFGSQYMNFNAKGLPDLDRINPIILQMSQQDIDSYRDELAEDGVGFDIEASLVTLKFATDIRLNRRDSWIIQAQGIIWHRIDSSSNLNESNSVPKFLNLDQILELESEGFSDISKSYVISIAHQWSWDHSYLRLGAGWSSMREFAFTPAIVQSIDYAWRFGGKSKNKEGRIRKGWQKNRKSSDKN